jgi:hypothetical protein
MVPKSGLQPLVISCLLGGLLMGCSESAGAFEDAARILPSQAGITDLKLLDSVTNAPARMGRTARFAVEGNKIAVVSLNFARPGVCADNADCRQLLHRNRAYALGQAAFAKQLMDSFAPCGFRGAIDISLMNVGHAREHQFLSASMALDRPATAESEPALRAEVERCAKSLMQTGQGQDFAIEDVGNWTARSMSLVVSVTDWKNMAAPREPLLIGWAEVMARWPSGKTGVIDLRIERGQVIISPMKIEP